MPSTLSLDQIPLIHPPSPRYLYLDSLATRLPFLATTSSPQALPVV